MARIPNYTAQQGLNVGGSFNAPDRPRRPSVGPVNVPYRGAPDGMGRALVSLGGAVTTLSDGLATLAAQREATADAAWISKARAQTAIDWLQTETALQQGANASAEVGAGLSAPSPSIPGPANGFSGYTERALEEFQKYRQSVLAAAPSRSAADAFSKWADAYEADIAGRAFEFEQASLFAQRADDLNTAFDAHVQTVFASPDEYDRVLAHAMEDLVAARSWMTPAQEIEAAHTIETSLQLARAKKLAQFEPLRFQEEVGLAAGPVMGTAAKIIQIESGGRASARNPKSSASGLGQFTNATWLAVVRKHRPDLAGLSDREVLALKTDPEIGREMTIKHTEDNINGLIAAGLEPTEGNVYLAHFAGIGGARQILTADPSVSAESILGTSVVQANPWMRGMTAGDLTRWTAQKMAGTAPANLGSFADNPKYSRLTPDQIFALARDSDTAIIAQHNAAVAERKAVYDARFNSLMLAIMDGQAGMADIEQARSDGWLHAYGDVKKAVDLVEGRDREGLLTANALARFNDQSATFNPYVADDRRDIDLAYKAMGGAQELTAGDASAVRRLQGFIEQSNIVPETAVAALQAGIRSRDAAERDTAFQVMDGLRRAYPDAVARAFDADDVTLVDNYQTLRNKMPPEELAHRLDPNQDPQRKRYADELRKEGLKLAAEVETAEILYAFDPGMTWQDPLPPIDAQQQVALRHDFETALAERYAITGDFEMAKAQAIEAIQVRWGTSEVGSDWRIMAFPPERYYPSIDGDWDWMADQLEEIVRAAAGETPSTSRAAADAGVAFMNAQSWELVPTIETEGATEADDYPPYMIRYVDAEGVQRMVTGDDGLPILARFNYDAALAEATEAAREQAEAFAPGGSIDRAGAFSPADLPPGPPLLPGEYDAGGYTTGGRF